MREIKFRAKTLEGELIYFDLHDSFMSGDSEIFYVRVPAPAAVDNIPCLIGTEQQFTGLLDKNGKEIYEGAVVEKEAHNVSRRYLYVVAWKKKWACYVMAIATETSGYINHYPSLESGEEFSHLSAPGCEIIGNIYENSELINEKTN